MTILIDGGIPVSQDTTISSTIGLRMLAELKERDRNLYDLSITDPEFAWVLQTGVWGGNTGQQFLAALYDALKFCAPDGYRFGRHPEDEHCYGFWRI